jgi:hypothetical protein
MARRAPLNGAILGVVFGLLRAIFGGVSGLVGGILAIVGFGRGYRVEQGKEAPMAGSPPPEGPYHPSYSPASRTFPVTPREASEAR